MKVKLQLRNFVFDDIYEREIVLNIKGIKNVLLLLLVSIIVIIIKKN